MSNPALVFMAKRRIASVFGLGILIFVVANAQFGAVAPNTMDGINDNYKINTMSLADPLCTGPQIVEHLETLGQSHCLEEPGVWNGEDLLMGLEGLGLVAAGFLRMPKDPVRAEKLRKVMFASGAILFGMAILDRLALLPSSVSSDGLVDIVPFIERPIMLQLLVAFIGTLLLMGPKYTNSEFAVERAKRQQNREKHREVFARTYKQDVSERITRSRLASTQARAQGGTRGGARVFATCPYCKGTGCKVCSKSGVF